MIAKYKCNFCTVKKYKNDGQHKQASYIFVLYVDKAG